MVRKWGISDNRESPGLSIMVSKCQCAYQKTMRYGNQISRTVFYAGANRDGYWTYEDLVRQLEQVILVFKSLHPRMYGYISFRPVIQPHGICC